ncbi:uncharacterized protein VNE69_06151 [Vairimorpha necatrix]|uniref:Uncharacterized protein n=1 Tax=Vairimorpha necatrix TaxID=6039 RepID=A0AAX4JD07_9MICR
MFPISFVKNNDIRAIIFSIKLDNLYFFFEYYFKNVYDSKKEVAECIMKLILLYIGAENIIFNEFGNKFYVNQNEIKVALEFTEHEINDNNEIIVE